jgi:pimeloyl-ACP methyl ester carboxylesterase
MHGFNHTSGQHLDILGARIYYEIMGNKSAPVLLFLHGGLGTIECFNVIISKLTKDFQIIGIDNRGHGKSTLGAQELSYELLQKEVEQVLVNLKIDNLSIVGFSNGGTIAYRMAALSNLKINKLVTIGAPWRSMLNEQSREAYSQLTIDSWKQHCPSDYAAYQKLNPELNLELLFKSLKKMALSTSETSHPNERVKNITCPLLIARGEYDPVLAHDDMLELSENIKGSEILTIPGAGHEVFHDQAELFVKQLEDFLACETKG